MDMVVHMGMHRPTTMYVMHFHFASVSLMDLAQE
jgi:hypothetical protein